ncbi:uncharacterized protein LOC100210153 [Hydra vulgaris]|uniref:uncharacterized protein LOC100210153 n=1 Tax=Hydra vulgaris TaxID=6087 RepID=UPI00019263C8|nr:uncharacterized protein LOC100210153 [Hydra vulgaris]
MKLLIALAIIGVIAAETVPAKQKSPINECFQTFYGCVTSTTTSWKQKAKCFVDVGNCLYNLCPSKDCLNKAKECYMKAASYDDFMACNNDLKTCFTKDCKLFL